MRLQFTLIQIFGDTPSQEQRDARETTSLGISGATGASPPLFYSTNYWLSFYLNILNSGSVLANNNNNNKKQKKQKQKTNQPNEY